MKLYLIITVLVIAAVAGDDFYDLLNVARDADNRDIRRAFKKLAVKMHPDKNPNDPTAHDKFLKINRAYEVLKDAELRKKYDAYGEEGLKDDHPTNQYRSWNFYQQDFGIYDEDKEIITLSSSDFVEGTDDIWFVNFYSPFCSHCHHLASTWRELAKELEGVVRIGAVNCEDDWRICQTNGIHGYPSLMLYPKGEKYKGKRDKDALLEFVLRNINAQVTEFWAGNFGKNMNEEDKKDKPWLITYCSDTGDCLSKNSLLKLAAMLEDLVNVGSIDCNNQEVLCDKLGREHGTYFYQRNNVKKGHGQEITSLIPKEVAFAVFEQLPDVKTLNDAEFKKARLSLKNKLGKSWCIHFVDGESRDVELRKLPAMLQNDLNVGRIDCSRARATCNELHVHKFPTFAVFKHGGGYEIHHGRMTAHDIAAFARDSANTPVVVLGPVDFPRRVIHSEETWVVDFFAPWCPPCMRLLPEYRKAAKMNEEKTVMFGTVDCTVHQNLCRDYNVRSYPTTLLYNQTIAHKYSGKPSAERILDFIQDTLHPPMTILNEDTFEELIGDKDSNDIWVIDFFAPWCGPCMQLAPEWRRLAKMFKESKTVKIGQVDCQKYTSLCRANNVRSYPTIRLYPQGSTDSNRYYDYQNWFRDSNSIRSWVYEFLPSKVHVLNAHNFDEKVLKSRIPWLVDLYAPWCGHCQMFAPEFERIAQELEGQVNCGKIDCDQYPHFCRKAAVRYYPTIRFYQGVQFEGGLQSLAGEEVEADGDYLLRYMKHRTPNKYQQGHDEL
ncbi:dnaJ homolog subfamily C member 10-like isoform X2 [Tubulanus polymorphus]|uniref:dnaJ homolog subfamily C member 10-like isoform X2 n=1 Tax=Tubulanus polymorphus TaxID=672921 RepID=UPI003DA469E9